MSDWQQRVIAERNELIKRINALENFIAEDFYGNLMGEEQRLLERQLEAMQQYEAVLRARISRF